MPDGMRRAGRGGMPFAAARFSLAAVTLAAIGAGACTHTPQPVVRKAGRAEAERPAAGRAAAPGAGAAEGTAAPAAAGATANGAAVPVTAEAGVPAAKAAATNPSTDGAAPAAAGAAAGAAGGAEQGSRAGGAPATQPMAKPDAPAKGTEKEGTFVVVDPADPGSDSSLTLAEAGKAEKERRATAPRPKVVITDKTLKHYATGQLTVAQPKKKAATAKDGARPAADGKGGPSAAADAAREELYWRHRVLEIRLRWRRAVDRVKELEQSAADWRRRFYSQDDPYVRDGQIKPSWDRALDELRQSKAQVEVSKQELATALEEGRLKGALPGWLREGIDLEPPEPKPVNPTEAIDPQIVKEPPINLPPES